MNKELTENEKESLVMGVHDSDADAAFKAWTEASGEARASEMGIKLTDAHWQVIKFIRTHYANVGPARHAREYTEVLNERFADEGGARYLYQLFPGGPVKQACAIAGVATPDDVSNNAFGTTV